MARIELIESFTFAQQSIVRVTDSDGAVGIGQTGCFKEAIVAEVLHDIVARLALGQDSADPAALTTRIWTRAYKFRGTFLARAMAGLDTALWDMAGRRAGLPVHALLGPVLRPRIEVYASRRTRALAPEAELDAVEADMAALGCRAVKLQIGERMGADGDALPGRTEALIPLARRRLGDAASISADANGGYSATGAIRVGRMLDAEGYHHFEEPCPFDDIDATKAVADALKLHVTGGEMDNDVSKFRQMIARGCVDVIQCDIGYCGGFSRALDVAGIASAHGMAMMPHAPNLSMLQVFTLHLLTAHPAGTELHEWRAGTPEQWQLEIYSPLPKVSGGFVSAPAGPGWGVEINTDYLARATRRASTWRASRAGTDCADNAA
jgi:L-alanine-DL-glutamate epimerase-like enolase superfamily enzyme